MSAADEHARVAQACLCRMDDPTGKTSPTYLKWPTPMACGGVMTIR